MKSQLIITLYFALVIVNSSFAQNKTKPETFPSSIHTQAKIWDTGTDFISLDHLLAFPTQANFQPLVDVNTNLGFTDHHYWVKFELENEESEPKTLYLETARPITDIATLYVFENKTLTKVTRSGDLMAFDLREIKHRKLLFPITLASRSTTQFFLYLKSDGEVINLPLTLHNGTSLIESTFKDQLVFGFFLWNSFPRCLDLSIFLFWHQREKLHTLRFLCNFYSTTPLLPRWIFFPIHTWFSRLVRRSKYSNFCNCFSDPS